MPERVVFDGGCRADPRVTRLIERLGIPISRGARDGARWTLTTIDGVLCLKENGPKHHRPLSVDLVSARRRHRSLPIARRGPLCRAVGRSTKSVIDATAGWGKDMFLMWMMGYDVTPVERSVAVGALLADGLARVEQHYPGPAYPRVEITDALAYLRRHGAECVYLDPMFATRRKASPLARRPLRVLRELVGDDADRSMLFDAAWRAASRRVVVKRPLRSDPWGTPDESFAGKIMTYDLYLKRP